MVDPQAATRLPVPANSAESVVRRLLLRFRNYAGEVYNWRIVIACATISFLVTFGILAITTKW